MPVEEMNAFPQRLGKKIRSIASNGMLTAAMILTSTSAHKATETEDISTPVMSPQRPQKTPSPFRFASYRSAPQPEMEDSAELPTMENGDDYAQKIFYVDEQAISVRQEKIHGRIVLTIGDKQWEVATKDYSYVTVDPSTDIASMVHRNDMLHLTATQKSDVRNFVTEARVSFAEVEGVIRTLTKGNRDTYLLMIQCDIKGPIVNIKNGAESIMGFFSGDRRRQPSWQKTTAHIHFQAIEDDEPLESVVAKEAR